ncbi:conserved membrane hypothetical protein [uncultured Defluviicoccus sp.]|uniref:Uncharacterized protein n=1 Tax=metagenome TaxID=256318 RepID=A0A380T7I8_9ZZZZ|nr:conserved membrane hypothetical protein [uncultured Defluviicoccus sp.]
MLHPEWTCELHRTLIPLKLDYALFRSGMSREPALPSLPMFTAEAQRLGLALAIGFLVGVERGWKQRDERDGGRVAGLRTFTLAGLLGGVAGLLAPLSPALAVSITLAFSAGFALFELRRARVDGDNSATSMIAGFLVFGLAAYAILGDPMLAAAASVAVTIVLAFKEGLHAWLGSLSWSEIRSALLILVATFIVLPFIPAGTVDPWRLIDPRSMWLMTIVVAATSFAGYVALRVLGQRTGLAISSFVGGLVSSTAVTLDLARREQASGLTGDAAASAALFATIASLFRVGVIATALSTDLTARLAGPLAAATLALAASAALMLRRRDSHNSQPSKLEIMRSPMDLVSVGWFAGLLCALTITAKLASQTFGHTGLNAFAATAGFVDVDAVVLSLQGLLAAKLPLSHAADALLLAAGSNQVFKVVVALVTGSPALSWRLGVATLAAAALAGVVYAILPGS